MRKNYKSSLKRFKRCLLTFLVSASALSSFGQIRDIGVVAMESPLAPHTGTSKAVQVRVRNFGTTAITSFKIGYTINSVVQTDVAAGAIPAPTAANPAPTIIVTLPNVTDNAGIQFVFWTKDANALGTDDSIKNDTLRSYTATPISGVKIVGATPSDYLTINDAVNALRYSGINGNTTFKIKTGTYFDNIALPLISTSAVGQQIVFETNSGIKDVLLISDPSIVSSIKIDQSDYVTIRNLKIYNRNITNGIGIQLINGANNAVIENCEIAVDSISNSKGFACIAAAVMATTSPYGLSNIACTKNTIIRNNKTSGGYYGILMNGAAAPLDSTNVVEKNIIREVSFYGTYIVNGANLKFKKNKVFLRASADIKSVGFYFQNIKSNTQFKTEIMNNYVTGAGTIGMSLNTVEGTSALATLIANNMIAGGFFSNASPPSTDLPTGIFISGCGWMNVYFNSVNLDPPVPLNNDASRALYITGGAAAKPVKIINNILRNAGKGYAYYNSGATATVAGGAFDYNDLVVSQLDLSTGPTKGFAFYNLADRVGLAALQAANGSGTHCINIEPNFFSDADLRTINMSLDQKGTSVGMSSEAPFDYDSVQRDQVNNMDPGVVEIFNGLEDWSIEALTPDVFKKGVNQWKIIVKYNGTTNLPNKSLGLTYWINGQKQNTIPRAFAIPGPINPGQTFTLNAPAAWDITRVNYQPFKLKVGRITEPGDARKINDTLEVEICVGLAGNYYVGSCLGASDSTFSSIQDAFNYLKCGVSGPTTLFLCPGVYNEQVALWKIRNSSATNTLTIDSKESSLNTKLTFLGGTAENNATLLFNSAQYIIIKDLTIENRNSSNGLAVQIAGNSRFNTITQCAIRVDSTLSPYPTTLYPIMFSKLGTLDNKARNGQSNTISKNRISGGSYGIAMFGQDTNFRDKGNILKDNLVSGFNKYGIYAENNDVDIDHNTVIGKIGMDNTGAGIFVKGGGDKTGAPMTINANKVMDVTLNGIRLELCRGATVPPKLYSSFSMVNNMVGGGFAFTSSTTAGIFLLNCDKVTIAHNSVNMDASRSSSSTPVDANVPRAMIVGNTNDEIEAFNNILSSTTGAIALEYFTKLKDATKTGLAYADNNNFYTTYSNKKTPLILIQRTSELANPLNKTNYSFFPNSSQSPSTALTAYKNEKVTVSGPGGGQKQFNKNREQNSLALAPSFEELPYNLHTNKPAFDRAAKNLKVPTDYDGESRLGTNKPDIGADEFSNPPIDLAIQKIYNNVISSARPNNLKVLLRNKGLFSLFDSVTLEYKVTSSTSGAVVASNSQRVKLNMKAINDIQYHTFSAPFTVPKGTYTICVKLKDGQLPADTVLINNILCIDACTGIEGNYYVGFTPGSVPGAPDHSRYFTTVQGIFNGVECGVAGPTFFYLNPAQSPYQERVVIPKYAVSVDSPLLTVLPYGTTDSTAVTLQQPVSGGDADKNNFVLRFQSSQFIKLQSLTVKNTNASFGVGVSFARDAKYNVIERCKLEVSNTATNSLFYPVAFSSITKSDITSPNANAKSGSYNKLVRNTIIGGYAGVAFSGSSLGALDMHNIVDSNNIKDFYMYGVYNKYHSIGSISFNTIEPRTSSAAAATSIYYFGGSENGRINANVLRNSKLSAIRVSDVEAFDDEKMIISNNWITSGFGSSTADSASGIMIKKSSNIGIYYNSMRYDGSGKAIFLTDDSVLVTTPEGPSWNRVPINNIQIWNNIIHKYAPAANGAYLHYMRSSDGLTFMDYNDYYYDFPTFGFYGELNQNDFGTWTINTPYDRKSLNMLPSFVSPYNFNLVGDDTLMFDGKGFSVDEEVNRDFYNRKRSPRVTDIGSIEYEKELKNLSVWKIKNDYAFYNDSNAVTVVVLNEGSQNISNMSATLEYSVDGSDGPWQGAQTFLLSELTGRYDQMELTFTQKYFKSDFHSFDLCVRITPTGRLTGDTITRYEQLCKPQCVGLNKGTYTIGKTSSNTFNTFQAAVNALVCGFDSSITFLVSPGIYDEQVYVPVLKTSQDTTVTFIAQNNPDDSVVLMHNTLPTESQYYVLQLTGTKYITFDGITFKNNSTSRGIGLSFTDNASDINVRNCNFIMDTVSHSNSLVGINTSKNTGINIPGRVGLVHISDCYFRGGGYGIRMVGDKFSLEAGQNDVVRSRFEKQYTAGIDMFYSKVGFIDSNVVFPRTNNPRNVGINLYGVLSDFIVRNNTIQHAGNGGIVLDSCRTESFGLIANNMIGGGFRATDSLGNYGLAIKNTGSFPAKGIVSAGLIGVMYNSVLYDGDNDTAAAFFVKNSNGLAVHNNIFANYGDGFALRYLSDGTGGGSDFAEVGRTLLFSKGDTLAKWKKVGCVDIDALGNASAGAFSQNTSPASASFDPVYKNNYDLHINHKDLNGTALPRFEVTTDIDGEPRSATTPDVGADEIVLLKNDLFLKAFNYPTDSSFFKGDQEVSVIIGNKGFTNVSNFQYKYSFDGVELQNRAFASTTNQLKYGEDTTLNFTIPIRTRQGGAHELCAYVFAPNDFYYVNDTLCITIFSLDTSDIGVIQVLSPLNGTVVDSLTKVKVRMKNFGNLPATDPKFYLRVNGKAKASGTYTGTIAGGAMIDYEFNYELNPDSAVVFDICAYSYLNDDIIPENDTACATTMTGGTGISRSGAGSINVFPNPANEHVNFVFKLLKPSSGTLIITDMLGKVVIQQDYEQMEQGDNKINLNTEQLNAGAYFFSIRFGDQKYDGRLTIVR